MIPERDNYAAAAENARLLFLKKDAQRLAEGAGLKSDEKYIYLRFMDMTCRIEKSSGYIQKSCGAGYEDDNGFETALSLYDYVCRPPEGRFLTGRWITMQELGHSFHTRLLEQSGGFFGSFAERFSGRVPKLRAICEALGGQKMPVSDAGYVLPIFDALPVYFQFWDGDDEFPPKVSFLWDENTERYIHYETSYYVARLILERLLALAE